MSLLAGCSTAEAKKQCYTAVPVDNAQHTPEPLCRLLEANLNEFCDVPPVVCGMKIAPRYAQQLSIPRWSAVDLRGRPARVEEIVRAFRPATPQGADRVWNEMRHDVEAAIAAGRFTLQTAQVDLFGTGQTLSVFRMDDGACPIENQDLLTSKDPAIWHGGFTSAHTGVYLAPETYRDLERKYT